MSLFSSLSKAFTVLVDDFNTPDSFKKGEAFEKYVFEVLFPKSLFDCVERTHSFEVNKRYVESSLKPDFRFRDKKTKKEFYVEVKFRSGFYWKNNKLEWCNFSQLRRYQDVDKVTPVYLLLGIGDIGSKPLFAAFMPLPKYTGLFESVIDKYSIALDEPIDSKMIWDTDKALAISKKEK